MRAQMRILSRAVTAALIALAGTACAEKMLTPRASDGVQLNIELASQVTTTRHVTVRVGYVTSGGTTVSVVDHVTTVATGTQQLSVSVDISRCLADANHVGGATSCRIRVIVELRDGPGGTLLDSVELPLIDAAPGSAPTPATVTVAAVSNIDLTGASVLKVGDVSQFSAFLKDAAGNVLVRPAMWSSTVPSVAQVSSSGLVTALSAGTTQIVVSAGGVSKSISLDVIAPVASVSVTPAAPNIQTGQTVQLTATPRDGGGVALSGRTVTFTSSAPAVASVSAAGLVTGITPGVAVITATSEGQSGTATVTVTQAPLVTLSTSALSQIHTFAVSPCPQAVGTVTITNVSSGPISWTASAAHIALTHSTSSGGTVPPGATSQLTVQFNCAQSSSFSTTITVTVQNAGGSVVQNYPVSVSVTVVP